MPSPPNGQKVKQVVPPSQDAVVPKPETKEPEPVAVTTSTPEEAPKEAKPLKVAEFGKYKLKSAFSLTQRDEDKKAEDEVEDLTGKPRTPFTQEQLNAKWKSFCYTVQKEGKAGLYATLMKHPVTLHEDFQLELVLDNEIQEMEMSTSKAALLTFLRKELNNYGIDLRTVINKNLVETKHLTNKDKFLKMVEKNPVLAELREKFGLDIEY